MSFSRKTQLSGVSKAGLPLRRRDCDSIKEKRRLHLIHGESSLHRGRAGGRSAITK
jgi:hypothetical protein